MITYQQNSTDTKRRRACSAPKLNGANFRAPVNPMWQPIPFGSQTWIRLD